ncbi:epoxide hydrolase family protein [Cohnella thailandensis]|uniref:Epoxide hydrolase n=1 Tax=Cohnella thailandensis TaxID=557557 RepID=A0A841SSD2_9BACL|nr:epoxide hydrolase family protein [Cohnella thailandensis]MBB6633118.1 epoxide hydrolase [Cohnella thailandensis]MBP1975187.1 pimeloyl-ACP methyl ester carboxylesterase [Cohnella thailandensis]
MANNNAHVQERNHQDGDNADIRPFRIEVPQEALDDLLERLDRTRWPDELPGVDWTYGTPLNVVKEMAHYWRNDYDWRKHEAKFNRYPQFVTEIDGANIHFIHARSEEPNAMPIILTHGWPGSFAEFIDMIDLLTDPRSHGGDAADAFHVVIPSVPGYTFSGPTRETGWSSNRIARAWATLMNRLGYDRYAAHGGDGGSLITRALGMADPDHVVGVHVLQLFSFPSGDPAEMANLSEEDMRRLQILSNFSEKAGFSAIQSTRPQTLAYALTDSPVGQLAWNELLMGMGEPNLLTRDQILTQVMMYWLTGTAGSSARQYYEDARAAHRSEPSRAPTGIAVFANDFQSIRHFAERDNTNIVHWSEYERGGHFAAMEVPDILAEDLRKFFRLFR